MAVSVNDNIHAWRAELTKGTIPQESFDDGTERIRLIGKPEPVKKEPGVVLVFDPRGCLSLRR